ncbi:MAG: hypothetical protein HKM95_07805, partial [Inquilinus sp.]|nr:hypothetical protein [Inquilinus sp.]
PYAAQPYTEVEGDDQFWRALFLVGYGPVAIEELKIGETPIGDFQDVEVEIREGYPTDPPRALFTDDVFEEGLSIALTEAGGWQQRTTAQDAEEISVDITFPGGLAFIAADGTRQDRSVAVEVEYAPDGTEDWSVGVGGRLFAARQAGPMTAPSVHRDEDGNDNRHRTDRVVMDKLSGALTVLAGVTSRKLANARPPPVPAWAVPIAQVKRTSGQATIAAGAIVDERPAGASFTDPGDFAPGPTAPASASIEVGAGTLIAPGLSTSARQTTTVRQSLRFPVPALGAYKVRLRRTTPDSTDGQVVDRVFWTALRAIEHTDPVQLSGVATVALRIRATEQLSGVIQTFNCLGTSVVPDWTGAEWVEQATGNPASLYRHLFQGPAMKRPRGDAQMDLAGIEAWADWCRQNGRAFNAYVDFRTTLRELAHDVAAAGRASRGMVDGKWSAVRDRPQTVPVQVFTPRNSWGFRASKVFADPPHGISVPFLNEAIGFKRDERIIYADGFDALTATRLETLEMFGFTDPDLVWRDGRFHQAVAKLRPETYELNVDFEHIVATRGDLVAVAHDAMLVGLGQGRVKAVQVDGGGAATGVTLDERVTMEVGKTYALIVRPPAGDPVTRAVTTAPGETDTLVFAVTVPAGTIAAGDLAAFGETDRVTAEMIVREIRPGEELTAKLVLVDAAPAVHDADQGAIPPFDSKVTVPAGVAAPGIESIASDGAVLFREGDGSLSSRIYVRLLRLSGGRFDLADVEGRYRIAGTPAPWILLPRVPAETREVSIRPVADGETYELQLRYVTAAGRPGDWGDLVVHTVLGKTADPNTVTGFNAQQNGNVVTFSWDQVPDLDLAGYEIDFGPPGVDIADAEPLTEVTRGTRITTAAVPPGEWDFFIRAVDTSGNRSTVPAVVSLTVVNALDIIRQAAQKPKGWPGSRTGFVYNPLTGNLNPDSTVLASADAAQDVFDGYVWQPVALALYEAPEIDIDFDDRARAWGDIQSNLGPGETGLAAPKLEIDYRPDADAYDGFEPWTIGEAEGRFFKFRFALDTAKGLARVTGFKPTVDQVEEVTVRTVPVAAAGSAIVFPTRFHIVPQVEVSAEAGAGGVPRYATWEAVTATGFTARIFDQAGAAVAGTLTYRATGV